MQRCNYALVRYIEKRGVFVFCKADDALFKAAFLWQQCRGDAVHSSSKQRGVCAMMVGRGAPSIGLVIDLPGNAGVSATNGFEAYANAAFDLFSMGNSFCDNRFPWFELDSMGQINLVTPTGGHAAAFSPVIEPGYQTNSVEALRARLLRMRVAEDEVEVAVSAMLAATRGAFGP